MSFFHLYEPTPVDEIETGAKPCCFADPAANLHIPGVSCHYCGTTWSGEDRSLPSKIVVPRWLHEQLAEPRVVPFEEYETLVDALRQDLHLPSSIRLRPGTHIGQLAIKYECATRIEDFTWITGGQVIVTERVVDSLSVARLTGCEVHPVHVTNLEQDIVTNLPPLYELAVVGSGGPMGLEAGLRLVHECNKCGYRKYENVYYGRSGGYKFQGLYINHETWDGSDFFTFDDWPTIIMISEKARSTLSSSSFSNWQAYPVPLGAFKW